MQDPLRMKSGGPEEEFRDEGCFDLRRVFVFLVDEKLRVPGFGLGIYFHFIFWALINTSYRLS